MDYQPITDALVQLRNAGLRAEVNLSDVIPPGVWLRLATVAPYTLDGTGVIGAELVCVVGETSSDRAYTALLDLYTQVADAIGGHDDAARFVTVNLPEGAAVPGLAIPVQLLP